MDDDDCWQDSQDDDGGPCNHTVGLEGEAGDHPCPQCARERWNEGYEV